MQSLRVSSSSVYQNVKEVFSLRATPLSIDRCIISDNKIARIKSLSVSNDTDGEIRTRPYSRNKPKRFVDRNTATVNLTEGQMDLVALSMR